MRSHPAEYEMASPGSLEGVLRLMDKEPGQWLPVAGATEVMVLFSAGKLAARRLVNLWGLKELREIREDAGSLTLGGGCTFADDSGMRSGAAPLSVAGAGGFMDRGHRESESGDAGGKFGECIARGGFASGVAGV